MSLLLVLRWLIMLPLLVTVFLHAHWSVAMTLVALALRQEWLGMWRGMYYERSSFRDRSAGL